MTIDKSLRDNIAVDSLKFLAIIPLNSPFQKDFSDVLYFKMVQIYKELFSKEQFIFHSFELKLFQNYFG